MKKIIILLTFLTINLQAKEKVPKIYALNIEALTKEAAIKISITQPDKKMYECVNVVFDYETMRYRKPKK